MSEAFDLAALDCAEVGKAIALPAASTEGGMSLEETVARRRSSRDFAQDPIALAAIGQVLWSAAGLTDEANGLRAAPSAGACYPLEVYLVCAQGLFRYRLGDHSLVKVQSDDLRKGLADAAFGQEFIAQAPITLVFAALYDRTTGRYGDRGRRYVHIDVGHAAQNVHLQAVALGLGSVPVGAFDDDQVAAVLRLPKDHKTLYLIPVGRAARPSA
jgi:SagB-type dehydrogenase family enzyme